MWQGRHHAHGCAPTGEAWDPCTLTMGPLRDPRCGKPDVYSVVVVGVPHPVTFRKKIQLSTTYLKSFYRLGNIL